MLHSRGKLGWVIRDAGMKVAVVGVGRVGAFTAQTVLVRELASEIFLYDKEEKKAAGAALDMSHAVAGTSVNSVRNVVSLHQLPSDIDIVVITAGLAQKPNQTRMDLLQGNAPIVRGIVEEIENTGRRPIYLIVTNPLDVMVAVAAEACEDPGRVIGTGTLLESFRLRYIIADRLAINASDVRGLVVGEHGPSSFVLWESVEIAGKPLSEVNLPDDCERFKRHVEESVRRAAYDVFEYLGATYHAISFVASEVVRHIVRDVRETLPVSIATTLDGRRTAMSMPVILGEVGIVGINDGWTALLESDPRAREAAERTAKALESLKE